MSNPQQPAQGQQPNQGQPAVQGPTPQQQGGQPNQGQKAKWWPFVIALVVVVLIIVGVVWPKGGSSTPQAGASPTATMTVTATATTTVTPSPTETTASPTVTATTTATPLPPATATTMTLPAGTITWKEIAKAINSQNATEFADTLKAMGIDPAAEAKKTHEDGGAIDPRVALALGVSKSDESDKSVRKALGIGPDLPVYRTATGCYQPVNATSVCPTGDDRMALVYAPLKGDTPMVGLGLLVTASDDNSTTVTVITYNWKQLS